MIETDPGFIRIRGQGNPLLTGEETKVEMQLGDGTWLPVRGVCSVKLNVGPQAFVTATVEIEVGALDLSGVIPDVIEWRDRRGFWRRLVSVFRP